MSSLFALRLDRKYVIENSTDITINRMSASSLIASTQKETRYLLIVRPSNNAYAATLSYTFTHKSTAPGETITSVSSYTFSKQGGSDHELCNSSDVGKNVEYYLYSEPISPTHIITVGTRVHGRVREYGYYQGVCGSLSPNTIQCSSGTKTIGRIESNNYYDGDPANELGFTNPDSDINASDVVSVIRPFNWVFSDNTTQATSGESANTGTPGATLLFSSADLNKQIGLIITSEYLLQQKTDQVLRELGYA